MHYQQIKVDGIVIEFYNNWLGKETVTVNGQMVSQKSSVWGCNHHFTLMHGGHNVHYVLTTRMNGNAEVVLDLSRNGRLIKQNIPTRYGTRPSRPAPPPVNQAKKEGLLHLKNYELPEALEKMREAEKFDARDSEVQFHLACIYSVQEKTQKALEAIKKAIELGLPDEEAIMTHDMLAFLRIHPAFEGFLDSGFKTYDESLIEDEPEEFDVF
ncbi:MAG: tetratricopeptide repeat protein [Bacteroidota bacterium]